MRTIIPETNKLDSCRIVERNDVLGSHTVTDSPQSVADAMRNHGGLCLAQAWIEEEFCGSVTEPVAVAIRKSDRLVVIHWHVTGNRDEAREAMRQILAGVRRCEL